MGDRDLISGYRIDKPGRVRLADWDTGDCGPFSGKNGKDEAAEALAAEVARLDTLQEKLYAGRQAAVLVVFQAMDTGGKDGCLRKVFGPLNSQGVMVQNFKKPTAEELAHDPLWRVHRTVPGRGEITVFNRSHYEDVLIVRVHGLAPRKTIERRYEHIRAFESLLADSGTCIIKFYLHISKAEQKKRLEARLADPEKHWKFNPDDLAERKRWDDYREAYELALGRCAATHAPWYVIPADKKWYRNWLVARIVREHLDGLRLAYPAAPPGLDKIVVPS